MLLVTVISIASFSMRWNQTHISLLSYYTTLYLIHVSHQTILITNYKKDPYTSHFEFNYNYNLIFFLNNVNL
jgi:hypothetical protein